MTRTYVEDKLYGEHFYFIWHARYINHVNYLYQYTVTKHLVNNFIRKIICSSNFINRFYYVSRWKVYFVLSRRK